MRYPEPDRDPWERQKGESLRAFDGFRRYRDMDPSERSIRKCVVANFPPEHHTRQTANYKNWSAKFGWVKRVEAWDDEVDRATRTAHIKAIEEMRERHVKMGRAMQAIAAKGIERISDKMQKDLTWCPPPGVMPQLMTHGTQIERLALGEPTTIAGVEEKERYVVTWADQDGPDEDTDDEEETGSDSGHAAAAAPDAEDDPQ